MILPLPTPLLSSFLYHPLPFSHSFTKDTQPWAREFCYWLYHLLKPFTPTASASVFSFPVLPSAPLSCWMMASATSVLLHPVKSRPSSALGIHTLGLLHANCPSCQLLWKETGSYNQASLLPNRSARQGPLSFARHSLPPSPWTSFPFLLACPGSSRPYKKILFFLLSHYGHSDYQLLWLLSFWP